MNDELAIEMASKSIFYRNTMDVIYRYICTMCIYIHYIYTIYIYWNTLDYMKLFHINVGGFFIGYSISSQLAADFSQSMSSPTTLAHG